MLADDDVDVVLEGATLVADVEALVVVVVDVSVSVDGSTLVEEPLPGEVELWLLSSRVDVDAATDVTPAALVVAVLSAVDGGALRTKEMTRWGRASTRLLSRLPRARAVPKESSSTWRSIQP